MAIMKEHEILFEALGTNKEDILKFLEGGQRILVVGPGGNKGELEFITAYVEHAGGEVITENITISPAHLLEANFSIEKKQLLLQRLTEFVEGIRQVVN